MSEKLTSNRSIVIDETNQNLSLVLIARTRLINSLMSNIILSGCFSSEMFGLLSECYRQIINEIVKLFCFYKLIYIKKEFYNFNYLSVQNFFFEVSKLWKVWLVFI